MKLFGKLVLAIAAAGVMAPAFAYSPAPQDHGYDHHDDHHDNGHDNRHDDRHDDHGNHGNWHPQPHGHWERGRRYDGRVVIVNDYRTRHLREPPRGYHWVRADNNDLLLVAIATGVIADIVSQ
jgi:Ni/Co efflux regulator RcnB